MAAIAVVGGGVAGLAAALALARNGHRVTLFERDAADPPTDPRTAPAEWERRGIPHFLQPHAFVSRGGKILREEAPDVYEALLDAGAIEIDLAAKMPTAERDPRDADLKFLGCRRPVIEWALRRAAAREPGVEVRTGAVVTGLAWDPSATLPLATGVVTQDGVVEADLVVDAAGRSSVLGEWIVDGGGTAPEEETSDCGLVYYSRYYRLRSPGRPEGPWLLGPRAMSDFIEAGTFWGDNDTYSIVQMVRPRDPDLRALRHPSAFEASLRAMPGFRPLADDAVAEPITPVLSMGQLRNTRRRFVAGGRPLAAGVVPVGDSLTHTNPRLAWGLSLALYEAFLLARLLDEHAPDSDALPLEFDRATEGLLDACYRAATEVDAARTRYWSGTAGDLTSPDEEEAYFLLYWLPVAGMSDAEVFRAAVRRLMLLDRPDEVEARHDILERAGRAVKTMISGGPPPPQVPPRDELVSIVRSASAR